MLIDLKLLANINSLVKKAETKSNTATTTIYEATTKQGPYKEIKNFIICNEMYGKSAEIIKHDLYETAREEYITLVSKLHVSK